MSMDLAKKTFSTQPDYLIAGNAEIVTAVKEASAALKRGAPVVLNSDGKLAAISVSGSSAPYTVTTTGGGCRVGRGRHRVPLRRVLRRRAGAARQRHRCGRGGSSAQPRHLLEVRRKKEYG